MGAPFSPEPFCARALRAVHIRRPKGAGATFGAAPFGAHALRAPHPYRTLYKGAGDARALVLAWDIHRIHLRRLGVT